jgi:hypothetical protein
MGAAAAAEPRFDALYNASAAAHFCGVRLVEEPEEPPEPSHRRVQVVRREDGRPWIDAEGWWERMARYRE